MPFKKIFYLIIAMTLLISEVCRANSDTENQNLKWATELGNNTTQMVWEHFQEQFKEQEMREANQGLRAGQEGESRQFAGLYIFVSSSMPKSLLKSYMNEAKQYGGVLIFKGLPKGSFKELIQLIVEISGLKEDELEQMAGIQIDDEAFDRFNVTLVPSIVLVEKVEYAPNQTLSLTFDKMSGNVPIKYALEQFADSGQLNEEARRVLYEFK